MNQHECFEWNNTARFDRNRLTTGLGSVHEDKEQSDTCGAQRE